MSLNEYITIVSIEGNIGSGKSTLLETLKSIFKENSNVLFLREPVDEWEKIKDKDGNTMLQKFYANQQEYSFAFQMMAYIYLNWFDEFAKDFPVNDVIYVNTDPTKCYERIHKRARVGEEVIPLAYLTACHEYHNAFLDENTGIKATQLVLNGNQDIFQNSQIVDDWIVSIKNFLQIE